MVTKTIFTSPTDPVRDRTQRRFKPHNYRQQTKCPLKKPTRNQKFTSNEKKKNERDSVCLSVCVFIYLIYLSIYQLVLSLSLVSLSVHASIHPPVYTCIYLYLIYLSTYLSAYLPTYPSIVG